MVYEETLKEESNLLLLKEQDYKEGDIYGTGTKVDYRSDKYRKYKQRKNPFAGGKVDLINQGDFKEGMFLKKPVQNRYQFGSKDRKRNKLVEMYGIGIMGLNHEVFVKFQIDIVGPRFRRKLKEMLGQ